MNTFIMLTRVSPEAAKNPVSLETLEKESARHIHEECKSVKWVGSYAIMGPFDYLDIFTAPDIETATRVSLIIRTYGRSHSEIWPAMEWDKFKQLLQGTRERSKAALFQTHVGWEPDV
ncbi:MAG: GYD domain-containing protein [Burkholderiales bacterium]